MSGGVFGRTRREREAKIQNGVGATLFMLLVIFAVLMYDEVTRSMIGDHMLLLLLFGVCVVGLYVIARYSLVKLGMISLGLAAVFMVVGFVFPPLEFLVPVFGSIGAAGLMYTAGSAVSDFWSDLGLLRDSMW